MSGILRGASAMKNGRLSSVRQAISPSSPPTDLNVAAASQVSYCYQLDDLTLEGVKCSLASMEGIYFEPLSDRFGSITVKRRLSMRASTLGHDSQQQQRAYNFIIQDKKGRKVAMVVQEANIGWRLKSIINRIYKFKTISISADTWERDIASFGIDLLMKSLLAAAVENELTDVRRFELLFSRTFAFSIQSMAAFVDQISPSLRHLQVINWYYPDCDTEQQKHHSALVTAVGHCDHLRSVDLVNFSLNRARMELMLAICRTPKLNALRILELEGDPFPLTVETLPPLAKHSFAIDYWQLHLWLRETTEVDLVWFKQFLAARIDTFNFVDRKRDAFPHMSDHVVALLETVIACQRSPPKVFVCCLAAPICWRIHLEWAPETLTNWLLLAERHRALITIVCRQSDEFVLPTVEQWAAIKDAIEEANITSLMPLPVHDPQHMTFSFHNGAKVKLLLEE